MEYQKIINLIGDDVESKFQTKDYAIINDRQAGNYAGSQIKIMTNMLRSNLCDFSRAYIKVMGKVKFTDIPDARVAKYCFKNCAPFTTCRLSINNTVVDDANFLDVVMPMYNLLEYSDNFNKTTGTVYNFERDVLETFTDAGAREGIWTSTSLQKKFQQVGAVTAAADEERETDTLTLFVPFTYLSTFFRSLEMPLINCEIELQLTWSRTCVLGFTHADGNDISVNALGTGGDNQAVVSFQITDTKTYIPVVTLRSIESEKLLRNLERGFSKTINWNKLTVRETTIAQGNFDIMIEPTFQGANRLFVLAYGNAANDADTRESTSRLFLPYRLIDSYNVSVDGRHVFESPIKEGDGRGYEHLRSIMIGNGDDYTVGSLIDYNYFKKDYRIIGVDLSRQRVLDSDPRAIQQINLIGNTTANIKVIFVMEESKDTILNFTQGTVKVV